MATAQKIIYVYDDFSSAGPILLGRLYVSVIKGGETYSFEYDRSWLNQNLLSVDLDPELMAFSGRQFPSGKNIFGLFADASPDRWGRILMNKRERILAEKEGRKPKKLYDIDFLLGVYDETRMGEFASRILLKDHSYQMIRRRQLRHGQLFVHLRKQPETSKAMKQA